jgi:hypothetical protein
MAVSCDISANPSAPNHGDTLTVTYSVSGNDAVDPSSATITGRVIVGGTAYDVTTQVTLPGTPAATVNYAMPTGGGLSFAATADPSVWTAVVP